MKAIQMARTGEPDVLQLVEVPTPMPGRSQVLVKAHTIGVNMPEVHVRRGRYSTMPPLPTSVTHTPGDTRFTLTHGGTTYNGTLSPDGSFRTDSLTVSDSTIVIEGRFAVQGFDANVAVSVRRSPTNCRYVVHWAGTKQGAPNVIP